MGKKLNYLTKTATRFVTLQLFISCMSLPILGHWGISQPILAPLGNMFFAPLLTLFLLFSTLIFFAYILGLPTTILIYTLEKITALWTYFLGVKIAVPSISCVQPPVFIIVGVPLAALCVVTHRRINRPYGTITGLMLILILTHTMLYYCYTKQSFIHDVPCNNGTITILRERGKTIVIDPGCIGKRLSAASWCEYTLAPEIIKKTGVETIEHCICLKPGKLLFDALEKMSKKIEIKNLYIPWWQGTVPRGCFKSYYRLKQEIIKGGGIIHRINANGLKIPCMDLSIKSTGVARAYYDAQFPQFYIEGIIDNNRISIYAP